MARISSLNVLLNTTGKDFLAEEYGKVIENIQKSCISQQLKNTDLSGTPTAGTVEAKRFTNTNSNAYGTARAAAHGQHVTAEPVVIAINQDKELIHEVEEKDVKLYGVDNFIQRMAGRDEKAMQRELERAFFTEATNEGTAVTTTATDPADIAEALIQAVETVKNDYVDGVDRDMINVVCTPALYGQLRTYLDLVELDSQKESYAMFHGAKIFSSVYLPSGFKAVVMADGAIAQPILPTVADPAKIQLSNAYAFGLFYSYGTKAVAPDLIFKLAN